MLTGRGNAASWSRFPKSASYGLDTRARTASLALTLALLSVPVFGWPLVDVHPQDGFLQGLFTAVVAACLLIPACLVRLAFNYRVEMGPLALVRHRLFASKPLRYSAISALTAVHDVRRASWRVEFQARDGSDMVVLLDDEHLRDDDLLAWLTSIPRRGGDAIVRPSGRRDGTIAVRVVSGIMLVLSTLTCAAFTMLPVAQARHLAEGYPPLTQLALTQGAVVRVEPCHTIGKGGIYLPIVVQTGQGEHRRTRRCEREPRLGHGAGAHHVAVDRGRGLVDGAMRQVEIDGHVVQSYDDFTSADRHRAPFTFVGESMLVASAWVLVLGLAVCRRSRR